VKHVLAKFRIPERFPKPDRRASRSTTKLMLRIHAATAQKKRELISERTKAALAATKARGQVLGGDRGYLPAAGPDNVAAALARRQAAEQAAHRLALEVWMAREAVWLPM
jgi:DNA invertase Pin-like site-specific DNA recombinase